MARKCLEADHEKLKAFGHDTHCTKCGKQVNPDAIVAVNCKTQHKIHTSRGLKYCPDCGE
ncbi:MAG: hypothetical protein AAB445_03825 [Patescibacteria group bacterium]